MIKIRVRNASPKFEKEFIEKLAFSFVGQSGYVESSLAGERIEFEKGKEGVQVESDEHGH